MQSKILLLALLFDLIGGEPPNRWHPVAWMGMGIERLRRAAPKRGRLLYGGLVAWGGAVVIWRLGQWLEKAPFPLQAWFLKTTFSLRGLNSAALEVEAALRADDLLEARRLLSWHLVSRDTSTLDAYRVAAAAIQSVAENTSDGIIAPLFWYMLGGLPAALVYRYLQTSDSLLGYRDAEREWLGKIPARTDDVLNLIPARLTALCLLVWRPRAFPVWRRDARRTASPNAGHTMSAMAGALSVELEKIGYYRLNEGCALPTAEDLRRARHLMWQAAGLFYVGLGLWQVLRGR
jgi:adenosylcobinamide-phosphate synthase